MEKKKKKLDNLLNINHIGKTLTKTLRILIKKLICSFEHVVEILQM